VARVLERMYEARPPVAAVGADPADLYFLDPSDRAGVLGTLGAYEVQEVIGQGGFGIVLKAYEPALHRLVAIKVLSPALAGSATARRRFTREAKAAAAVCHDHIVTVYGVSESDGLPYLVMQYVAGESLQQRLDRTGPLGVVEIVRIGMQTASGLAAAHAQGLIHRDVKPANLLLENGVARVKITDFGLARMADDVGLTQNGVVAGTPEYMAPEQARGEAVDHRADLFSLGSVLYACGTGRPPFRGATALAVLRRVSEESPASIRSLNPAVPAWLERLVGRLMANDPAERFPSAAEVAALLEGYLAHLCQPATVAAPELPAPPASQGRGVSGLRRRPWPAALLLLALAGLGVGLTVSALAPDGKGVSPQARLANDPAARAAPPEAPVDEGVWTLAFSPDGKQLVKGGARPSRPGQLQIWDLAAGKPSVTRRVNKGVRAAAFSPDGQVLAAGGWDGKIGLCDPLSSEERAPLMGHKGGVNGLAFSADGALLASAGLDKTVRLWDVKARQEKQKLLGHTGMVFSVAFFRHGRAIVTGSEDRTARIWDLDAGKERFVLRGHEKPVEVVALSPDDQVVATGSWDQTIKLWGADTGRETAVLQQEGGWLLALAFSPAGRLLASGSADGTIHFWDVATGKVVETVKGSHGCRALAFSPDGKVLASGSEDGTATLWDVATARDLVTLSAAGVEAGPDQSTEFAPPARRSKAWLTAVALVLGLLLALALALRLFARQGRRAGLAAPASGAGEPGNSAAGEESIPFPCPFCGRRLKARADLAGKKCKCPQCAEPVSVPGGAAGESARIP
jgi:hypothetical protein